MFAFIGGHVWGTEAPNIEGRRQSWRLRDLATTLSALVGLTCYAIEWSLMVEGRNAREVSEPRAKATLLSVLTFQSADAKL